MKEKDGSAQLKIGGILGVIFGVLGILSVGFVQSRAGASLLSPEELTRMTSPAMLFQSYWFGVLEILFGVYGFYFATHPEKNALCQSAALGLTLCYVIPGAQMLSSGSVWDVVITCVFLLVPIIYVYGAQKQREVYYQMKQLDTGAVQEKNQGKKKTK